MCYGLVKLIVNFKIYVVVKFCKDDSFGVFNMILISFLNDIFFILSDYVIGYYLVVYVRYIVFLLVRLVECRRIRYKF